jgi:hypothetical protein
MVTFDFICQNESCEVHGVRFESLLKNWQSPDPECPKCGRSMERQPAAPKCVFVRPYHWYDNRGAALENYDPNGVKVVRRKTVDGKPQVDYLTTYKQMKEFCKSEGYAVPGEVSSSAEVDASGKTLSTRGVSGQWI